MHRKRLSCWKYLELYAIQREKKRLRLDKSVAWIGQLEIRHMYAYAIAYVTEKSTLKVDYFQSSAVAVKP